MKAALIVMGFALLFIIASWAWIYQTLAAWDLGDAQLKKNKNETKQK